MAVSGRESPSEQHYSLKWNDYSVKLVTAFQSLRDEEDFVDVTVACDGHQYSAHKMVLSACSPYFRSMLRANPCQHPIVILKDVGHNEMERLLEFMYNGEVNIAQDQLAAFLRTAENLKIRGLAGSSDDMEQIYNRDYGNMSTSDKLFNQQQQQQQNSTSVSAMVNTNTSSNSSSIPHNEHDHQGMNSNNGFAKEESDGLSHSGGVGLSVPTADCYSPAHKKRKLVMLNNTDQDSITDGDATLVGSGDADSVAALVTQAGPLGVEVKCLSRDLKAEPCEAGTETGLTAGGEAVYSISAGGDDPASHDQIIAPHLYTIGVGGSTGGSGGTAHQDLNSAAQHNDQGAVAGCEALNLSVRPHHNQRPPPPSHLHRDGSRQHHHQHYEAYQHDHEQSRQHFTTAAVVMTGSGSSTPVHHGDDGTNQDLRVLSHHDLHHHATRSSGHHRLRPVLIATCHSTNHDQQQQHVDAFSSRSGQHLTVLNLPREDEGKETGSVGAISYPVRGRQQQQQQPSLGRPLHHLPSYHVSPPGRPRQLLHQPSREVSPNSTGLVYRVKLEYPEPKQEYLDPDDSTPMDLGAPVAARTLMSGARDHHHHHRQLNLQQNNLHEEHGDLGTGGEEDDGHLHHNEENDDDGDDDDNNVETVACDGSNALLLRSSSVDLNDSAKSTLSAINNILSAEMMDQRGAEDNDLKLPFSNRMDIDGRPSSGPPYGGGANNGTGRSPGSGGSSYRSGGGGPGKVYPCSECHKVFRHPMSLHHHRHVHRGTYTCQSCSKVFSRRWDLHRHLHRSKLGCRRPSAGVAAPGGDSNPVVIVSSGAGGQAQQEVHVTNSRGDAIATEAASYEDEILLRNGHQSRSSVTGEERSDATHSFAISRKSCSSVGSSAVLSKSEHQGSSNNYSSSLIVSVKSSSSLAAAAPTNTVSRHPLKQWHHQQKQLQQNVREDQASNSSPKMEYNSIVDDDDGDQCNPNSSDTITNTVDSNGHYSRPSNAAAAALHHNPSSSCSSYSSSTSARPAATAAAACSASYAAAANRASCGGGGGLSPPSITPSSSNSGAASLPLSSSLTTGPSN